jgi:DNA-binding transcriptional LysR family regulator
VPENHELAGKQVASLKETSRYPLIGINPAAPYGGIVAKFFSRNNCPYDSTIRARFRLSVCSLARAGLGVAVVDQFTVAHDFTPGIKILRIVDLQTDEVAPPRFAVDRRVEHCEAPSACVDLNPGPDIRRFLWFEGAFLPDRTSLAPRSLQMDRCWVRVLNMEAPSRPTTPSPTPSCLLA